jgi:hypothetical protein
VKEVLRCSSRPHIEDIVLEAGLAVPNVEGFVDARKQFRQKLIRTKIQKEADEFRKLRGVLRRNCEIRMEGLFFKGNVGLSKRLLDFLATDEPFPILHVQGSEDDLQLMK